MEANEILEKMKCDSIRMFEQRIRDLEEQISKKETTIAGCLEEIKNRIEIGE